MWIRHDNERPEDIDCLLQTIGDGLAWYGWRWAIGNAAVSNFFDGDLNIYHPDGTRWSLFDLALTQMEILGEEL